MKTSYIINRRHLILAGAAGLAACSPSSSRAQNPPASAVLANAVGDMGADIDWVALTEDEWRARLSPAAFKVLRKEGTERPFSSALNNEKRAGTFHCAGCDLPLFLSEHKYDSGTGWPSFWQPLENAVGTKADNTLFMRRTEYHCARCGGHQGHVFEDGPRPTSLRYCNNGIALRFKSSP